MENKSESSARKAGGARIPLATIQKTGGSVSSENEMVGRKSTSIQPKTIVGEGLTKGEKDKWAGRVNKSSSNNRAKKSGSSKQKLVDQAIQTWATRLELELTNDEPSPSYWRELAESRGSALEEAMIENEYLHNRIDELETENSELEELVQEAKNLAEMVQSLTDDEEENDDQDSGIYSHE